MKFLCKHTYEITNLRCGFHHHRPKSLKLPSDEVGSVEKKYIIRLHRSTADRRESGLSPLRPKSLRGAGDQTPNVWCPDLAPLTAESRLSSFSICISSFSNSLFSLSLSSFSISLTNANWILLGLGLSKWDRLRKREGEMRSRERVWWWRWFGSFGGGGSAVARVWWWW